MLRQNVIDDVPHNIYDRENNEISWNLSDTTPCGSHKSLHGQRITPTVPRKSPQEPSKNEPHGVFHNFDRKIITFLKIVVSDKNTND